MLGFKTFVTLHTSSDIKTDIIERRLMPRLRSRDYEGGGTSRLPRDKAVSYRTTLGIYTLLNSIHFTTCCHTCSFRSVG